MKNEINLEYGGAPDVGANSQGSRKYELNGMMFNHLGSFNDYNDGNSTNKDGNSIYRNTKDHLNATNEILSEISNRQAGSLPCYKSVNQSIDLRSMR